MGRDQKIVNDKFISDHGHKCRKLVMRTNHSSSCQQDNQKGGPNPECTPNFPNAMLMQVTLHQELNLNSKHDALKRLV
jgi:hypothetical protein